MSDFIDFRSDTVTQPTIEMRKAMMEAVVGDDILGEDPTVDRLEERAAELLGKEAGLFLISGTMANQVAIMAMTQLGDEILVGEESHIYNLEVAGIAALSGVQARPLRSKLGRFDANDVAQSIRSAGLQSPVTRLICLENTYNLNKGIPLPKEYFSEIMQIARSRGVKGYLDGARLFNAALATGDSPKELCSSMDAVMFCLSKGLCAPVGAMLVGDMAFIERANWIRQRIGGGMRQAGHMAAAGLVALDQMIPRLAIDHDNAKYLISRLNEIDVRLVNPESGLSNVVMLNLEPFNIDSQFLVDRLFENGIKIKPIGSHACRMITHNGIEKPEIDYATSIIRRFVTH